MPFLAAQKVAQSLGYGEYSQGYGNTQGRYIGHSIGLEIDEFPTLYDRTECLLQSGMVLTIEPKFIIPGWGAVCVEDSFMLTDDWPQNLSPVHRELTTCPL